MRRRGKPLKARFNLDNLNGYCYVKKEGFFIILQHHHPSLGRYWAVSPATHPNYWQDFPLCKKWRHHQQAWRKCMASISIVIVDSTMLSHAKLYLMNSKERGSWWKFLKKSDVMSWQKYKKIRREKLRKIHTWFTASILIPQAYSGQLCVLERDPKGVTLEWERKS